MSPQRVPPAQVAREAGLPRLGGRPPLGRYLAQAWDRRHFAWELARARFRSSTEQDRLGIAWVVIRPLINAVVYGFVFVLLLRSDTRPEGFVPFLVAGVFIFAYWSGSLSDGAKAISGSMGLVRTLHFPRVLLPVATVIEQALALGPMVVVLAVTYAASGEPPRPEWLLLVPALLLMTAFNLGVALIAARLTIHVRDIAQLLPFVSRLFFYLSGIFYSVELTVEDGPLKTVMQSNPVHIFITLVRDAFSDAEATPSWMWPAGAAWAVVTLLVGLVFFWQAEERYARE
ncbi:ABC transporter permease [Vallicoccus soli]|uniref:Transport permease protein n=1 Tax=Vallicoccus soli TaxID=2339232 RepID=A0A3A3YZ63_9ACTN|nr:ABC transporter permease [Vallicoccus soli]RJK95349.1 ABC transporter permease [Vallicoccus soli]